MIHFVIALNLPYYHRHGRRFIEEFLKFTPDDCRLIVYNENTLDATWHPQFEKMHRNHSSDRVEFRDLWKITNVREWHEKARPVQEAKMKLPIMYDPHERVKYFDKGYEYKFEALGHSKPVFAQHHILHELPDGSKVIFLDIDITFLKKLDERFFVQAFPEGVDLTYLGRKSLHSETGFLGFNVGPRIRAYWAQMMDYYMSGRVFSLPYWTDSHVFDQVRSENKEAILKNISTMEDGHVFINCFLGEYMDHMKGNRKVEGRSRDNEYVQRKKPS